MLIKLHFMGVLLLSVFILNTAAYSQNDLNSIDAMIKEKQAILLKTKRSHTTPYISLHDELVELIISKNNLLLGMDRGDEIDTDKTCDIVLKYEEVEFIKTQYYKTPFHDEIAKTLENIASLYKQCHPPMAEKYLKSILSIKEHIYLKNSVEVAKAHDALGDYYQVYMSDFTKSISEYETANKIRKKIYGTKDPRITENYERLALSLYYHGDKNAKAEKLLLSSIAIREKSSLQLDFPLYVAYMDVGIYYSMKNAYDKSIGYLLKALQAFPGTINRNYIVIVSVLSQNYLNKDDLSHALEFAEKAYTISKEFYGSDTHSQVLENLNRLNKIKNRINK